MIDAIHHAANAARSRSLSVAQELLEAGGVDREAGFFVALEALLEVLPAFAEVHGSGTERETWPPRATTSRRSTVSTGWPTPTRSTSPRSSELWKDWAGD